MTKQTKKSKKKNISNAQKVGLGVGLTAAAVTAAGAYFLYGSDSAPKNRKKVKSWMLKARAEVLETLEKAEDITQEEYETLIEVIGGAYSTVQNATRGEVNDFKKEMKDHWKKIEKTGVAKEIKRKAKKARKNATKSAKLAVKKVKSSVKKGVAKKAGSKTAPKTKKAPKKTAKKATKKAARKVKRRI